MKIGRAKVRNLRQLFEQSIKIRDIAQPLFSVQIDEAGESVRKKMKARDFNVAGVMEHGKVTGYICKEYLGKEQCGEYRRLFEPDDLAEADQPLLECFAFFKKKAAVFCTEKASVTLIATRSDLQRIPVRMLLFGLLCLMELYLTNLIRKNYSGDEWKVLLTKSRIDKAVEVMEFRKLRNEATELVDCLQFGDKKLIFEKTPALASATGTSINELHSFFEDAEALRDNIAHVQDVRAGKDWSGFVELVEAIKAFVLLCERLDEGSKQESSAVN